MLLYFSLGTDEEGGFPRNQGAGEVKDSPVSLLGRTIFHDVCLTVQLLAGCLASPDLAG